MRRSAYLVKMEVIVEGATDYQGAIVGKRALCDGTLRSPHCSNLCAAVGSDNARSSVRNVNLARTAAPEFICQSFNVLSFDDDKMNSESWEIRGTVHQDSNRRGQEVSTLAYPCPNAGINPTTMPLQYVSTRSRVGLQVNERIA